jgi:hypothetical protein
MRLRTKTLEVHVYLCSSKQSEPSTVLRGAGVEQSGQYGVPMLLQAGCFGYGTAQRVNP